MPQEESVKVKFLLPEVTFVPRLTETLTILSKKTNLGFSVHDEHGNHSAKATAGQVTGKFEDLFA